MWSASKSEKETFLSIIHVRLRARLSSVDGICSKNIDTGIEFALTFHPLLGS